MRTSFTADVVRRLCSKGYAFETRAIQHGRQIIFAGRSVLNLFETGRRHWQRDSYEDEAAVEAVIASARKKAGLTIADAAPAPPKRASKTKAKGGGARPPRGLFDNVKDPPW
jgi:hypothetical protein